MQMRYPERKLIACLHRLHDKSKLIIAIRQAVFVHR
ncbi:hypothetical protein Barb4_04503 [Bacteroidales bacterium Barb4]|nr:hypothetical protein Barb4_04503 [Bacteroidales bacterium Barb4]